jgi:hypothetical protein
MNFELGRVPLGSLGQIKLARFGNNLCKLVWQGFADVDVTDVREVGDEGSDSPRQIKTTPLRVTNLTLFVRKRVVHLVKQCSYSR